MTFYNAIANNGVMVKPKFVEAIIKDGLVIKENPTGHLKKFSDLKNYWKSAKTKKAIQTMISMHIKGKSNILNIAFPISMQNTSTMPKNY